MKMIRLPSGVQVRVLEKGVGTPVLMLHGNPDNADEWIPLIDLLKNNFRCIAPDLPGYGRYGKTQPLPENFDYSKESQTRFVNEILQALDITGPLHLIVHDIGGIMGIPWAAENLDRVQSVVYTNTVAFPRYQWFPEAYIWGSQSALGKLSARFSWWLARIFGGFLFRAIFAKQNPQLTKIQIRRFTHDFGKNKVAQETTIKEFQQITKTEYFDGFDQMLKKIAAAVPTTALWGIGDPYVKDQFAKELYARELILLPEIGHWVPLLAADKIAAIISRS